MIPILYESTETEFASNGLGRLYDVIEASVVEERNGVYELDFSYPITGANYDEIKVGRIIGVTHDESGDIQPFDIVSYTKPINGVVNFHCTHLSYRQCYIVINPTLVGRINSLASAIHMITTYTNPENPFIYWTDKRSGEHLGCATGIPYSVRSVLGGVKGSILDTYGGEYEWDKWTVKLWERRGQDRDFTIRYGVNMLDYNEEYDIQGTYSSCLPYWTDGTQIVLAPRVVSGGQTVTGREQCVPLDLSVMFEAVPTTGQLQAAARTYMAENHPFIPKQNIHVEFARLQDIGYEGFESLFECNLCDTITVIFPDYNSTGQFKIVKTVWDVLRDRYESMELGDLSVTLSEALGVTQGTETQMPNLDNYVEKSGDTMTGGLTFKSSGIDTTQANNGVTANADFAYPMYRDVNDRYTGFLDNIAYTSGNIGTAIYASNYDSGGNRNNNYLGVIIAKDGTQTYSVANPAAFRTAINALADSSSSVTATKVGNYYSGTGITAMKNGGCVTVKVAFTASATFSGRTTIAKIPEGYRPMTQVFGYMNGTTEYFIIESNGDVKFNSLTSGSSYYGVSTYCKA